MIDSVTDAKRAAGLVVKSLTDLGYAWQTQAGDQVTVRFNSVAVADLLGATWAICEVDTLRLPRRVTARDLTKPETIHHLATVVGHPVRCLNSTGVTYCIQLTPPLQPARPRLPRQARLDLALALRGSDQAQLPVPIGVSVNGPVWRPLVTLGHTLIAGASGSGKSNWIHVALAALLTRATRDQVQVALVDPKTAEFAVWSRAPHLYGHVAVDEQQAVGLLDKVIGEMDRRGEMLRGALVRDLAAYNQQAAQPLPYVVVVIDEVVDLLLAGGGEKSPLGKAMMRIAVKGRSTGIILWIASQHSRFDLLPRSIALNLGSRLVFRVQDAAAAHLAGGPGAHEIARNCPGRFIANLDGKAEQMQAYHVSDEDLLAITSEMRGADGAVSAEEAALVRYAVAELGGGFVVNKLAARFAGQWTHHRIRTLAELWERRGWLTTPASVVEPRRVTPALMQMVEDI